MSRLSYLYLFLVVVVVASIGGFFEIPFPPILLLIILIAVIFLLFPTWRIFWGISDAKKIEQILLKNKRNPFYRFYYGLANGNETDVDESVKKINLGFHPRSVKKQYQLIAACFHEQPDEMEKLLKSMKNSVFTLYYQASQSILTNDFEGARRFIDQNPKLWMREALTAELLAKENQKEEAIAHARLALSKTKGLQRFLLLRNWEREWNISLE